MNEIKPKELNGARIYFTGFDKKAYNYKKSKEEMLKIIEKNLKVMLLTKNRIVFGASHLKSDLAQEFIIKNPEIFEKGLVVPALRDEHNGDLSKAIGYKSDIVNLFNSCISWSLKENTQWFHMKMLEGFENEKSILRINIKHTPISNINSIIDKLKQKDYFDREISNKIIPTLIAKSDLEAFKKYQTLVYSISGARVVNCQSALDQENMLFDYSISDIENRKIFLNEVEIFHRIFIDQIFKILEREKLDFFDRLTFKDIIELREIIENSNFILKYNSLIEKSTNLIKKKDFIDFYSCSEILELAEDIRKNFYEEIDKQVDEYYKNKVEEKRQNKIFVPIQNLMLSMSGLSGLINNTKNILSIVTGTYDYVLSEKDINYKKECFKMQQNLAQNIIDNTNPEWSTSFIDIFKMLQEFYLKKYVEII